ncbi:hypothetical protein THRCLA_22618 [Thraustotheca clavata]|uniref:Uncharacterized protein n=1 Tax=Thraustotheca clavata TaxID=74557 RepID=A0A1V9YWG9_9STRA|nr:hypothetical protein THRCLA_22618 [Thraustotheca clavata]
MSKLNKSKTPNLEELNNIIIRDLEMSNDKLSHATMSLYLRQLVSLYRAGNDSLQWDPEEFADRIRYPNKFDDANFQEIYKVQNSDVMSLLTRLYKDKESFEPQRVMQMVKNTFEEMFDYYNAIRKAISNQNKADKLDNELAPEEQKKYISHDELTTIPEKSFIRLQNAISQRLLSSPSRLADSLTKKGNYLQGTKLYLNDFKNVRLMGPQVIDIDGTIMHLIAGFLQFLDNSLAVAPKKLLWLVYNNGPGEYEGNNGFSVIISKLFVKYNGKPMSVNMIRHIEELHLIQSPTYAKLTNREKHDLHAKLLHSTFAANTSDNKIQNRTTIQKTVGETPDFGFEPDHSSPSPAKSKTQSKGHFKPTGSEKHIEIEKFETKMF